MSIINNWNDVNALKSRDKISYKDKEYIIQSKDIDHDQHGIRIILTLKNKNKDKDKDKELIINHLGEIGGDFNDSNLSKNKLKKISSGGKRKTRRHRKTRAKKTRRYHK